MSPNFWGGFSKSQEKLESKVWDQVWHIDNIYYSEYSEATVAWELYIDEWIFFQCLVCLTKPLVVPNVELNDNHDY